MAMTLVISASNADRVTIRERYGHGLVTIALAESGFEKATMMPYEVLTRCNNGYEEASSRGKIEMCFVSVGIQVRQHIVRGQFPSAKCRYEAFLEKVTTEHADWLQPNMDAFEVWLNLFSNAGENAGEYIQRIPSHEVSFNILDRYRQMIRLRCLIAQGQLDDAMGLANFLTGYFTSYERHFYWMENELLKAVILYRLGDGHWRIHLTQALEKAAQYHFVRLISLEGRAVLPLLREMEKIDGFGDIPESFVSQVIEETEQVASFYPEYLNCVPKEEIKLTKRENEILTMLCSGKTTEEICEECGITYNGLKKHIGNIYRKFGVNSRAEAEWKAFQLGMVHRTIGAG